MTDGAAVFGLTGTELSLDESCSKHKLKVGSVLVEDLKATISYAAIDICRKEPPEKFRMLIDRITYEMPVRFCGKRGNSCKKNQERYPYFLNY